MMPWRRLNEIIKRKISMVAKFFSVLIAVATIAGTQTSVAWAQADDLQIHSRCEQRVTPPPSPPAQQPPPPGSPSAPTPVTPAPFTPAVVCDVRATQPIAPKATRATVDGKAVTTTFQSFDSKALSSSWLFLVQNSSNLRMPMMRQIQEMISSVAGPRTGKRKFALATYSDKLQLAAPFDSTLATFNAATRDLRTDGRPVSELYRNARDAIAILEKDGADRRALVIISNGKADDKAYTRDELVAAARAANVMIYSLAFSDGASGIPNLQTLRRIAEDANGLYVQADVATWTLSKSFRDRFIGFLENVGKIEIPMPAFAGARSADIELTVDFVDGRSASSKQNFVIAQPAATPAPSPSTVAPTLPNAKVVVDGAADKAPDTLIGKLIAWIKANSLTASLLGLGALGCLAAAVRFASSKHADATSGPNEAELPLGSDRLTSNADDADRPTSKPQSNSPPPTISMVTSELLRGASSRRYGWLQFLDATSTKIPIGLTTVKIGRHDDNDIRIDNKTVHRRHAVMHLTANEKFAISDLGTQNGIFVNRKRVAKQELNDGDLIELGEVRFRFLKAER